MKATFFKYALPIGMGLTLSVITIFGLLSTSFVGCTKDDTSTKHCTSNAYPLYCPVSGNCCPAGYAWNCDGQCYQSGCPSGTVSSGVCASE
jgi:hypothetical protein